MTPLRNLALALLVAQWNIVDTSAAIWDAVHGYIPISDEVHDVADVARDLAAMRTELKRDSNAGMEAGWQIYRHGGFSRSTAKVTLKKALEFEVPQGTVFKATSIGGQTITAYTETTYNTPATELTLIYNQDVPCHVGGLPESMRETDGCFASPGSFAIEGDETGWEFTYDEEGDNENERTIHSMSTNAERKYRIEGKANQPYFHDFQKFVDYYGEPDFADNMITAARNAGVYEFEPEGTYDFVDSTHLHRGEFIQLTSGYISVAFMMMSELENSLLHCANHCEDDNCEHAAVHALDAAVAYYTGSLQSVDGQGNMLYALANYHCTYFKTCGENGDETHGPAKVNIDIFNNFNQMQKNLHEKKCVAAQKNKKKIIDLMYVPMTQGFILAVFQRHMSHHGGTDYLVENAAPFASAILPLLGYCEITDAEKINYNFEPGNQHLTKGLIHIIEDFQTYYPCMNICCHEVGGLWNSDKKIYENNTAPCIDTREECLPGADEFDDDSGGGKGGIFIIIFLLGLGGTGFMYYRRKAKAAKAHRRAAAEQEGNDLVTVETDDDKDGVMT
jgi:hypothetical protein